MALYAKPLWHSESPEASPVNARLVGVAETGAAVTGCFVGVKVATLVGTRETVGWDDGRNVGDTEGYDEGRNVGASEGINFIPHSVIKNSCFSALSMTI